MIPAASRADVTGDGRRVPAVAPRGFGRAGGASAATGMSSHSTSAGLARLAAGSDGALGGRLREGRGIAPRRREPRVRGRPLRLLPPLLRDLFHRVVLLALQLRLLDALRVGAGVSVDGSVEPSLAVVRLAIDDPLGRAELLDALFVLEVRHGEVVEDLLRRGERRELRLSASFDGWEEGGAVSGRRELRALGYFSEAEEGGNWADRSGGREGNGARTSAPHPSLPRRPPPWPPPWHFPRRSSAPSPQPRPACAPPEEPRWPPPPHREAGSGSAWCSPSLPGPRPTRCTEGGRIRRRRGEALPRVSRAFDPAVRRRAVVIKD